MLLLLNLILIQQNPSKNSGRLFCRYQKLLPNIIWEGKGTRIAKTILKQNRVRWHTIQFQNLLWNYSNLEKGGLAHTVILTHASIQYKKAQRWQICISTDSWFFKKVQRRVNRENTVFNKWCWYDWIFLMQRNEPWSIHFI